LVRADLRAVACSDRCASRSSNCVGPSRTRHTHHRRSVAPRRSGWRSHRGTPPAARRGTTLRAPRPSDTSSCTRHPKCTTIDRSPGLRNPIPRVAVCRAIRWGARHHHSRARAR
jgi:hypothetical protein